MINKRRGAVKRIFNCIVLSTMLGCSATRHSQTYRQDKMHHAWMRKDTTGIEQLTSLLKSKEIEIKHVSFLSPDSMGRQFVQSVTHINTNEEECTNTSSSVIRQMEVQDTRDVHLYEEQKGTTEIKSNWGIYLAEIGFCIFLVLLIYYICRYA